MNATIAARCFLGLIGFGFVAVGVFCLFLPLKGIEVFEIDLVATSAFNEIRASYGGMHVLLGIFFLLGAFAVHLRRAALLVATLLLGGLVIGRMSSFILDGSPNDMVRLMFVVECVGFAAGAALVVLGGRRDD